MSDYSYVLSRASFFLGFLGTAVGAARFLVSFTGYTAYSTPEKLNKKGQAKVGFLFLNQ